MLHGSCHRGALRRHLASVRGDHSGGPDGLDDLPRDGRRVGDDRF